MMERDLFFKGAGHLSEDRACVRGTSNVEPNKNNKDSGSRRTCV